MGYPVYVLALDVVKNTLVVGPEALLYRDECLVGNTNFIPFEHLTGTLRVEVKVRYTAIPSPAVVTPAGGDRAAVKFDAPERAITPGQAAVFYDGDLVVGGGTILRDEG
jgi:tRNA-specific 2-thiouridylase